KRQTIFPELESLFISPGPVISTLTKTRLRRDELLRLACIFEFVTLIGPSAGLKALAGGCSGRRVRTSVGADLLRGGFGCRGIIRTGVAGRRLDPLLAACFSESALLAVGVPAALSF